MSPLQRPYNIMSPFFYHLSATWHSSAQRGTAKEYCGLSSAKAFNGQVMEI
jgi:hypothetical protein